MPRPAAAASSMAAWIAGASSVSPSPFAKYGNSLTLNIGTEIVPRPMIDGRWKVASIAGESALTIQARGVGDVALAVTQPVRCSPINGDHIATPTPAIPSD